MVSEGNLSKLSFNVLNAILPSNSITYDATKFIIIQAGMLLYMSHILSLG